MNSLILLIGYTGVGKSHFLAEAKRYNIFSVQLRRMWEAKNSNNRILAKKALIKLEQKTGNRNEWLNILLPEIQNSIEKHNLCIFEGISTESEINWIEENIQNRKILLIYIFTNCSEKRIQFVSKRENVSIDQAKAIILRSDKNRNNLGMEKLKERAHRRIENKYDNSFLDEIRDLVMELL